MNTTEAITERISGWTGAGVIVRHDHPTGSWIFIALHDFTLGRPSGGTRMKTYPALADAVTDAVRLAEGMTSKWAAIDFDYGGGKCVIAVPRPIEGAERLGLLERYGRFLASLGGTFTTGVDLGITPEDMAVVARHCSWVHGIDDDGSPIDPGPFTGRGVYVGLRKALEAAFGSPDPAGRKVVVQGLGDVGWVLAGHLAAAGAEILASDLLEERVERAVARPMWSTTPSATSTPPAPSAPRSTPRRSPDCDAGSSPAAPTTSSTSPPTPSVSTPGASSTRRTT